MNIKSRTLPGVAIALLATGSVTYGRAITGLFVGAKYNLTKRVGVFLEVGPTLPRLRGGISFKF